MLKIIFHFLVRAKSVANIKLQSDLSVLKPKLENKFKSSLKPRDKNQLFILIFIGLFMNI